MKFEFSTTPGHSHVSAIFESHDLKQGKREDAPGDLITFRDNVATFDYEVSDIHPDILGLLCMVIFYPFIGTEVEFPKPVSRRFADAFDTHIFRKKKVLKFRNVSDAVEPYQGDRTALSFGGGIDSTAVRLLFPDAFLVHESHAKDGSVVYTDTQRVVNEIAAKDPLNPQARVVASNTRSMNEERGRSTWLCATATSLLLATDHGFGLVMTGTPLGSTFLKGGKGFVDRLAIRAERGAKAPYWPEAFSAAGIPLASPIAGIDTIQVMNIALDEFHKGNVSFCYGKDGTNCMTCAKCFSRVVIASYLDKEYDAPWEGFMNPRVVRNLMKRPLFMGQIYATINSLAPDRLPTWARIRLKDLPKVETDWAMRCYVEGYDLFDERVASLFRERVLNRVEPMSPSDIQQMRSWTQDGLIAG